MTCNNISALHWPEVLNDSGGAIVAHCKLCHAIGIFRYDGEGRPNNREYSKWFKRDTIQQDHPLYFKYHESQVATL